VGASGYRLPISDLGFAGVRIYFELPEHSVADNFEMQFAHAGDDGLAGVLVRIHAESWIFFSQALQRDAHFFLIQLCLWLNRHRNDGIRKGRRLEQDWMVLIAESIAGGDVLDANDGCDVARITSFDVFALVRLNLDQTRNPFALVRARIVNGVALGKGSGINPEENQLADEWVAPKLERERAEISTVVGRRLHWLMRIGLHPLRWRNIQRAWQVIDNCIEQVLDTDVLQRRTANDRHKF